MNETEALRSAHFVLEPDGTTISISDVLITQGLPAFVIGSDDRAHLRLTGSQVAPGHAALRLRDGRYVMQYLPGAPGIESRPGVGTARPLNDGDMVQIGSHSLRFTLGEPFTTLAQAAPAVPVAAAAPAPAPAVAVVDAAPLAATPIHRPAAAAVSAGRGRVAGLVLGVGVLMAALIGGVAWLWLTLFPPGPAPIDFAYNDGNVTLVMFDADWCEICKQQRPIVDGLKAQYRGDLYLRFVDIDALGNTALVQQYNVSAVPRILIIDDMGQVTNTFFGLTQAATLRAAIDAALVQSAQSPNPTPVPAA
jgi:thiol-disulfide isomerase/thioredoxin